MDEKNGFLIVTTSFELRGEAMEVDLTMFDVRSPRVTKLTGGSFEAASFKPKYVQRGALRRERP